MKKQDVYLLLITVSGILLSSCSNLSKMSLTKRHYRSGYYVDFGGKNPNSAKPDISKQSIKTNHQTVAALIAEKPGKDVSVPTNMSISEKSNTAPKIVLFKETTTVNITKTISYTSNKRPEDFNQNVTSKHSSGTEAENEVHARVDVDIPYVVIVLCAIFIPPLGVGLMYGLNDYFWIDLILTLLFFFPGMIFALIIVLM